MYFVLPSSLNSTEIGIGPRSRTYIHPQDILCCRTNFFFVFLGGSPFPHFFTALRRHTPRELITLNCILCAILVLQTLSLSLSFSLFLSSVFTRRRLHHLEKKKSDESNKAVKREHASFVVFCLEKRPRRSTIRSTIEFISVERV